MQPTQYDRVTSSGRLCRWFVRTAILCITALFVPFPLSGCHSTRGGGSPSRSEQDDLAASLSERAQAYWVARGKDAWSDLYEYQPPRIKADSTVEQFIAWALKDEPFKVEQWTIVDQRCQGSHGWVRVDYTASLRRFPTLAPKTTTHWQRWVSLDGVWYPVPKTELDDFPETPAIRDGAAEAKLGARFAAAWNARKARDWSELYALTDPRDRDAVSLDQFVEAEALFLYINLETHWVEVIGDRGRVRVTYDHKPADPSMTKMPTLRLAIIESWVYVDRQWYRDLVRQQG